MNTRRIGLTVSLVISLCCNALGQSSFSLRNYDPPRVNAPVFDPQGVPLAGAKYLAELWGSANSNSLAPLLLIPNSFSREIVPFRSEGYFRETSLSEFLVATDVLPGGYAWLQLRAWDAQLGPTYEAAAAQGIGGYGESPVFYAQGGDPSSQFPVAGPLIGLQSFSLRPLIPEPSASVLLALGATALCWAKRRRARQL